MKGQLFVNVGPSREKARLGACFYEVVMRRTYA